ncbi:hypothetical protein XCR1_1370003 [Xenorhabdus cabanillasii JM26]|uniref:Uncharacterized protein n=1 Tax=Xenorhabdus cabanillasii JM26 TaxID=1427517 RepID=W1IQJ0_9GAMM|nr:hypothetical protein XCR1_1370003 [Xenorhabdus cabanillasii JM26]
MVDLNRKKWHYWLTFLVCDLSHSLLSIYFNVLSAISIDSYSCVDFNW